MKVIYNAVVDMFLTWIELTQEARIQSSKYNKYWY
jgi:hypothetical protein